MSEPAQPSDGATPRRVFLHVGLPKSGTTYIQAVLHANRTRLAETARLCYPGETWSAQVLAARDVLSAHPGGEVSSEVAGAWDRLVAEMAEGGGDGVVSMEWLGSADREQAERMVRSLAPAEVELVVTIRDLGRTIPAAWQEFVQNQETWTWVEFLRAVSSEAPRGTPAGNLFWLQQDVGRLLAIWRDLLPAERLHVVTIPQRGAAASELWCRFASVLGVDAARYDASGRGSNESLGAQSAEFMRRLNEASRADGLDWSTYDQMFKHALAKRGLSRRRDREPVLRLPPDLEPWVLDRTGHLLAAITDSGAQVVGDLGDLTPVFDESALSAPPSSDAELLEVALDGLVLLARDRQQELGKVRAQRQRLQDEVNGLKEQIQAMADARAARFPNVRQALVDASEKHGSLMSLRRGYRWNRDRSRRTDHP